MRYIKDSKEFNNSIINDILDFFKSVDMDPFRKMLGGYSKITDISNQIDVEEEKEYSELKYTLMDDLDVVVKKWKENLEEVREDLYMKMFLTI